MDRETRLAELVALAHWMRAKARALAAARAAEACRYIVPRRGGLAVLDRPSPLEPRQWIATPSGEIRPYCIPGPNRLNRAGNPGMTQ